MHWFEAEHCAIQVGQKDRCYWAQAPANIALIKYMGKACHKENQPDNPSLSYTLMDHIVRVELQESEHWSWQPLEGFGLDVLLTPAQQQRFIQHAQFVVGALKSQRCFRIQSAGNFPSMCGLASSAASFAALTAALVVALGAGTLGLGQIAALSQQGSGSSCRSFLKPWVVWDGQVQPCDSFWPRCLHQVVVVADRAKAVSSSQAHQRVASSALYAGRSSRAQLRFNQLRASLISGDWAHIFALCWQEFWDMHALFHTANPAFSYLLPETLSVLNSLQDHWQQQGDGPIVTLDAGANIHLLYRLDQVNLYDTLGRVFF